MTVVEVFSGAMDEKFNGTTQAFTSCRRFSQHHSLKPQETNPTIAHAESKTAPHITVHESCSAAPCCDRAATSGFFSPFKAREEDRLGAPPSIQLVMLGIPPGFFFLAGASARLAGHSKTQRINRRTFSPFSRIEDFVHHENGVRV